MALISIQQGAVAKSSVLNDNFNYLESLCTSISNSTLDKTTINNLVNSAGKAKVNKTGDTMTGNLNIEKVQGSFNIKEPNLDCTTTPTANNVSAFRCIDKNSSILGDVRFERRTDGSQGTIVLARNKRNGTQVDASITVGVGATGNRYTRFNVDEFVINGKTIPYVTEHVISGTSWYRVWSNGWKEQGGITTDTSDIVTYNLLKSFSNTNYTLTLGCVATGSGGTGGALPAITAKTTSTFSIHYDYYNTNKNKGVNWYACGK
jgi:hypothetical protein